jgi:hypothetical protein
VAARVLVSEVCKDTLRRIESDGESKYAQRQRGWMTSMYRTADWTKRAITTVAGLGILLALTLSLLMGFRLVTGRGLGFGLWRVKHLGLAVLDSSSTAGTAHGEYTNVIFLHHSTGHNLIEQGGIRERFSEAGFDFWDHGYNAQGLRRPDGSYTGYSYRVPRDNTDPDGLAEIFAQRVYPLPLNVLSGLLQHEVIAFKSCFPVSHVSSNEQLEQYKSYYLHMRDVMDNRPDHVFIVMSPPPLNPAATGSEAANRARGFADWLKSDEYLSGHPNVFTFDFFSHLAEDEAAAPDHNMLRVEYREGQDSHPNQEANKVVGPLFVDFVIDSVESYRAVRD